MSRAASLLIIASMLAAAPASAQFTDITDSSAVSAIVAAHYAYNPDG